MLPDINDAFTQLQEKLLPIWTSIREDDNFEHTSLIIPSLSVDQEELSKVQGASFYEERLMFALIRLRNPNARLIYVTSQPVHPDVSRLLSPVADWRSCRSCETTSQDALCLRCQHTSPD